MKTVFSAKVASFSDDDEYGTLLAFADDPVEPVNYVRLGLANEPDEQDVRLRLDGVHIEAGATRVEGYDLVHDIRETDAGLVVSLTPDAARKAGMDQDIEIDVESRTCDGITLSGAIQRFRDRLSSLEQTRAQAPDTHPG